MIGSSTHRAALAGLTGAVATLGTAALPTTALAGSCDGISFHTPQPEWTTLINTEYSSTIECTLTWGTRYATRDSWRISCAFDNNEPSQVGDDDVQYVRYKVNGALSSEFLETSAGQEVTRTECGTLGSGTVNNMDWLAYEAVNGSGTANDELVATTHVKFGA